MNIIDYGNEKLNQIFRDTWSNLGWAKRMTEHSNHWYDYTRNDINRENPFVSDESESTMEINDDMPWVNLTQEEVTELRNKKHQLTEYGKQRLKQLMNNQEPYPDEMFEEAERREKSNRVLQRYNRFYNLECASMPHGTTITPEHQQALTLDCMIAAIRCEYLNRQFNEVPIHDIEDLIQALDQQGKDYIERVGDNNESI